MGVAFSFPTATTTCLLASSAVRTCWTKNTFRQCWALFGAPAALRCLLQPRGRHQRTKRRFRLFRFVVAEKLSVWVSSGSTVLALTLLLVCCRFTNSSPVLKFQDQACSFWGGLSGPYFCLSLSPRVKLRIVFVLPEVFVLFSLPVGMSQFSSTRLPGFFSAISEKFDSKRR